MIENFDIKFQSKMCYAPHSLRIRFAFAQHLPPEGKAIFIALSRLPLGGKLSQKATDEGRNLFSDTNNLNAAFLGFPFGEALPRSGGGEVGLKFSSSLPLNP